MSRSRKNLVLNNISIKTCLFTKDNDVAVREVKAWKMKSIYKSVFSNHVKDI